MVSVRQPLVKSFGHIFKHKVARLLMQAYVIYLVISIAVVTPLLNWAGAAIYQQQTGRALSYSLISFNPFTLAVTLHHPKDRNPDNSLFWAAQKIQVNPSLLQTLVRFAPTLDALALNQVQVAVSKSSNDQWNFADILQHQANQPQVETETTAPTEIPPLVINQIALSIQSLQFTDASHEDTFHTSVDDLEFVLQDFSTIKDVGQPYYLRARSSGGELIWQGNVSVKRGSSEGELSLKNISLQPAWQYFKPYLHFALRDGAADFSGHYAVNWQSDLSWSLSDSRLAFNRLDLRSRAGDKKSRLAFSRLSLDNLRVSSQTELVEIDQISLDGLAIASWSEADQIGLVQMLTPELPESPSANDAESQGENNEQSAWGAYIKAVNVKGIVDWQVAELNQHAFKITPLELNLTDIHTAGETAAQLNLTATIDAQTQLQVNGDINPLSLDGNLATQITQLPLSLINPLLQPYLNAEILAGNLDVQTQLALREAAPITLTSNGKVTQFRLRPLASPDELISWEALAWQDTHVDLEQQQLTLPLLALTGFDSRFIITKEGTTNLQSLFPVVEINPSEQTPNAVATPAKPWQFTLQKLSFNNASFRFHDESLTPDFTAAVQHFSGELIGLTSDTKKLASFNFKGDVDGYAPVTLNGKAQPFLEQPKLDATLNFENMDLGGFSTYSSTYAGWRIDRGLLTANLHYRLADGRIVGDNHIVMDQLQLGERVRSASAMDIPLRLALALLTDENGVATLDVGISGRPDDPSFDISKVIWSAVRNTLMKIVTAPFSLLANLVGADEDLGEIKFNSGSTQLLSKATRKLTLLEEALNKRPQLRLDARGQYDVVTDTRGLRAAQAKPLLLAEGLTNDDIKKKTPAWQKVVTAQYRRLDVAHDKNLSVDEQYAAWLNTFPVTDEDLRRLAVERSVVVKQFLVEHLQVSNDRVLVNAEIDCSKEKACSSRTVVFDLSETVQ